jgi:hypothetical protein
MSTKQTFPDVEHTRDLHACAVESATSLRQNSPDTPILPTLFLLPVSAKPAMAANGLSLFEAVSERISHGPIAAKRITDDFGEVD